MSDFLLLPFDILVDQLLSPADDFLSPPVLMALLGENLPDRDTGTVQLQGSLLCKNSRYLELKELTGSPREIKDKSQKDFIAHILTGARQKWKRVRL